MPVEIFCCYARKDKQFLKKLIAHLMPLQREGLITIWADKDINAGSEWEQEIGEHLNKAQIILLLVSPDFINSDYCYSIEMKRAIERHESREARVIPIILRPVHWQNTPFGKLQVLPIDATPVIDSKWHSPDEAFLNVTEGICRILPKDNSSSPSVQRGSFPANRGKTNTRNRKSVLLPVVVILLSIVLIGGTLLFLSNKNILLALSPISIATPASVPVLVQHPPLHSEETNQNIVPFSKPVKAGDLIIVAITQWVGVVSSVTDNQGNTYASVVKEAPYATSHIFDKKNHDYAQLYYAKNLAGGTTTVTVTVTFTARENTNVGIYEFSGFNSIAPLDQSVAKTGYSQSPNGGTLNTTTNNELCFVVGVDDDGQNKAPTPGNQYGSIVDSQLDTTSHERYYTEYLLGASKGSYQTDFLIATASNWAVVGAAFKVE